MARNLKRTGDPVAAHRPARPPAEAFRKLQEELREAHETLEAIRSGEVDAVVVTGPHGNQIYSLAGADEPYRIYVERMEEGAVTVSAEAVVLYCNRRFAEMLHAPIERVMGSNLRDHLADATWDTLAAVFTQATGTVKCEASLRREGAKELPVKFTASRLPLDGQEVMCLVTTDLTQSKEQEGLRLAKEIAEKASLAKDAFLAALSHELRTPLNPALIASVALEQDATLPPEVRMQLAMIRRNVELEARLIDDLLDLTRVAQGKLELQSVPLELHAVVLRALEICRPDLEAKRHHLVLNLDARHTRLQGDTVRLQQVVWNLLRNAAKFTPPGGTIALRTDNPSAGAICLEVRDSGIGFGPDAVPRMFLPFEQCDREITRQFGGLGLGLAISRSIVDAHGGTLAAASAGEGRGATFSVTLPLHEPEGAVVVLSETAGESPTAGEWRILLVEDHADTRASMERILRRSGHHVVAVGTAREALAAAGRESFDVVVADLGLPDLSGIELMQQLRDAYGLRGIATSGYGMDDDIAKSRAAGFVSHLVKPIRMDRLRRALAELGGSPVVGRG
jgi:signal transduction histidine kinase/CheY-like chemotaxis protein